jgi:hypothetical protein
MVLSYRGPHGQGHLVVARAAMVDSDICVAPSGSRSMRAISICSPHRHAGPSVQPGSNKRSDTDIEPPHLTDGMWPAMLQRTSPFLRFY